MILAHFSVSGYRQLTSLASPISVIAGHVKCENETLMALEQRSNHRPL